MNNLKNSKYLIETGIGLQDVDHLKNSTYFLNQTKKYLKGEISLDELDQIISSYYKSKRVEEERTNRNLHVSNLKQENIPISKSSRILKIIQVNPHATTEQISKEIGCSVRTVKNVLKVLVNSKQIKRVNGKRYGHWEIC